MTLSVEFSNNPRGEFRAGQQMAGSVRLDTTQSMTIRGVSIRVCGVAWCRWSFIFGFGKITFTATQTFFNSIIILFGLPSNSTNRTELPAGSHDFPFRFQLPTNVPHSFQGKHGYVKYYVKATVDKPWAFNNTRKHAFTITPHLDLNRQPHAMMETRDSAEMTLCCLCCTSGLISASVFLDRKGYVPGDIMRFYGEISNLSSRDCGVCIYLMRRVTYKCREERKESEERLGVNVGHPLPAGKRKQFSGEEVLIPLDCGIPSFLQGCGIIEIHYYATLKLTPSGPASSLRAQAEVIIGTVPHRRARAADSLARPEVIPYPTPLPVISQPGLSQSVISQPGFSLPVISQPGVSQPVISQPAASSADGHNNRADDDDPLIE